MKLSTLSAAIATTLVLTPSAAVLAGTPPYFVPLTESAPVMPPNAVSELTSPWVTPAGIRQQNLLSLRTVESLAGLRPTNSILRVPAGTSSSMFDMISYHPNGNVIFIPHETPAGAGVSRHDFRTGRTEILFGGDQGGFQGDWSNDWGAFDPTRFTPWGTVWAAEEWTAEGRVIEVMNPMANPNAIRIREVEFIANVAHEGIEFSEQNEGVVYYIDEWNSGSIYKFVPERCPNVRARVLCEVGQTSVLVVNAFAGNAADDFFEDSNVGEPRTGAAHWVPITDDEGIPLTTADPFRNGPTSDPRVDPDTRGGRPAADEMGGTPYGRPEDTILMQLPNGNEALLFAATSENTIYMVEELGDNQAHVSVFASGDTPKNVGFDPTTGALNSPDNLALDANGNVYIIEDAPNNSSTGGDIWFARDADNDGVAESLDHFLSIRVDGSESTGMVFNPRIPTEFVVAVQHPDSTDLSNVPDGFGDAVWIFDISEALQDAD